MGPPNSIGRQAGAEIVHTSTACEPVTNQPKSAEYLPIDQAKAEKRRVIAIAVDQENSAKVQEMIVKHSEALAAATQAMSQISRTGKAGFMD